MSTKNKSVKQSRHQESPIKVTTRGQIVIVTVLPLHCGKY